MTELLRWNIYEISAQVSSLNGVMLRGRIRKYGIENGINVLTENAEDKENRVRYATLTIEDGEQISRYVQSVISDVAISMVNRSVINPVLSKQKVNIKERYSL